MQRLLLCTVVAALSGCQCFVPVDEPDASLDAGASCSRAADCPGSEPACEPSVCGQCRACRASRCELVSQFCPSADAGTDAGTDAGCTSAAQCTGSPGPGTQWCDTSPPDAGFSCVESTCLWECPLTPAGRTCTVDQGSYCLRCGDAGTTCPQTGNCGGSIAFTATVEQGSSCTTWPGTTIPFTTVDLMRTASAQCRYFVSGAQQTLGEVWRLETGEYLAYFPGLGGWCTGRSAFTGVPRGIFNCPACQFVLEGFE